MNKAKLKSYAPQARKDFIAAVTARANLLGLSEKAGRLDVAASQPQGDVTVIAGQPWPVKVHSQRQQLIARIQKDGFAQTMEAVAYTWFNRFAALRYMELHDYLGHGHRALSSLEGNLPDILTYAADLAKDGNGGGGLPGLEPALVTAMKLAGNRDSELYRLLLVAQCNALSDAMPFLFERIDDETELLLPDNLLRTDSVISKLVAAIDEGDWAEVEIIGWLYQYYISERKEEVIGKVVKSDDIPAATQLFTPNWIVQYLVQNSVGRLWLMANPASNLKAHWRYIIEPAQQTFEAQAQLDALIQTRMNDDGGSLNPESISLLDPACGSGHILVEAYEVLKVIYLERGYQPRAIPRLILEKNLFGLDIDDRAAQMAGFALLMKARADDRRLFEEPIRLNVLALRESRGLDADALIRALQPVKYRGSRQNEAAVLTSGFESDDLFPETHPQISLGESSVAETTDGVMRQVISALISTFAQAKTYGSLIQVPHALNAQLATLASHLKQAIRDGDLYAKSAAQDILPLVEQAQLLGMQFDAVVANPPYMGGKGMNPELREFAEKNYKGGKADLFAMFILRIQLFGFRHSRIGLMTPFVWMFLNSYEAIRTSLTRNAAITSLVHPEYHSFFESAFVPICAFVIDNSGLESNGSYYDLRKYYGADVQSEKLLEALQKEESSDKYTVDCHDFSKIQTSPIAYWVSSKMRDSINESRSVSDIAVTKQGLITGNNNLFLRYWYEVDFSNIGVNIHSRNDASSSRKRWFPCVKGGAFRKWYGNNDYVVDWEFDGERIRNYKHSITGKLLSRPQNLDYYFREGLTWSTLTVGPFSMRWCPNGAVFESKGSMCFVQDASLTKYVLAYLNTKLVNAFLCASSPTLDYHEGPVSRLPCRVDGNTQRIIALASKAIEISQVDWDAFEISQDFENSPLVLVSRGAGSNLADSWQECDSKSKDAVLELKDIEEKINGHFIHMYGLDGEVSADVPVEQITLARADREKDCQRLISYAIGCMMGRYSLDAPGLIYAHAGNVGFDENRYVSFPADYDGIVPLTRELWFQDDAAGRINEFLNIVFGAGTLAENMAWLAESLGTKANETPDETIRRYMADKFYKDHLQTYRRRPIYWLFSSGKQGAFQALVYLHRYHEGTLARLRAEYVVPLTGKVQSRIDMLEKDAVAAVSTATRNKLTKEVEKLKKQHVELLTYDEQLRHYADMRIALDLDDGVKVNYGKFGNLLAEVNAVTGGTSDD